LISASGIVGERFHGDSGHSSTVRQQYPKLQPYRGPWSPGRNRPGGVRRLNKARYERQGTGYTKTRRRATLAFTGRRYLAVCNCLELWGDHSQRAAVLGTTGLYPLALELDLTSGKMLGVPAYLDAERLSEDVAHPKIQSGRSRVGRGNGAGRALGTSGAQCVLRTPVIADRSDSGVEKSSLR
jgi:hypothetical protein